VKNIIQIAGIIDAEETRLLVNSGVDWLGFPLRLPVNKEDISETNAAKIVHQLPAGHAGVVITYLERADDIHKLCKQLGVKKVQVHGKITITELQRLRQIAPDLFILKSLIVRGDNLPDLEKQVALFSPLTDGFITDTHDPKTGADGATGKTHDWRISRRLVEISPKPVMLAGGLKPENVFEAIITVRPAAVDAHTGVEDESGRKNPRKLQTFVDEARRGFFEIEK